MDVVLCEICAQRGEKTHLQLFQINFDEAIWMCPNIKCPYPVSAGVKATKTFVVPRPSAAINQGGRKRRSRETSRSTSCSSSRSGSPVSVHGRIPLSPSLLLPNSPPTIEDQQIDIFDTGLAAKIDFNQIHLNDTEKVPSQLSPGTSISQLHKSHPQTSCSSSGATSSKPLPKFTQQILNSGYEKLDPLYPKFQNVSGGNSSSDFKPEPPNQSLNKVSSVTKIEDQFLKESTGSPQIEGTISNGGLSLSLPPEPSRIQDEPCQNTRNSCTASDIPKKTVPPVPARTQITEPDSVDIEPFSAIVCPSFEEAEDGFGVKVEEETPNFTKILDASTPKPEQKPNITEKEVAIDDTVKQDSSVACSQVSSLSDVSAAQKQRLKTARLIQWQNRDALCWLDVAMCLLVQSRTFTNLVKSSPVGSCPVAKDLLNGYADAQKLIRKVLELNKYVVYGQKQTIFLQTSFGMITVKTGGGDGSNVATPKTNDRPFVISTNLSPMKSPASFNSDASRLVITTEELKDRAMKKFEEAQTLMLQLRENVWRFLYPKLRCEKGKHDSPVFALHFLLGEDPQVKKNFVHNFAWKMLCRRCGYKHHDKVSKPVVTLPEVPHDFTMRKPYFLRPCLKCEAPNQRMEMVFDNFPPVFFVHFVEGLHRKRIASYDFFYNRQHYTITGVIQWKQNPDHFVAWLRNPAYKMWMKCDDLEKPLCHFEETEPDFPPSQVHVVMWTRKSINTSSQDLPEPMPAVPLKSALKTSKSPPALSTAAKRKVLLDSPMVPVPKKATAGRRKGATKTAPVHSKTVPKSLPGKSTSSTAESAQPTGKEAMKKTVEMERKDLIAKLMHVPKKQDNSFMNVIRSEGAKSKVISLKPEELAKRILSHGLIPAFSKPNPSGSSQHATAQDTISAASSLPAGYSRRTIAGPSFSGYVPRMHVASKEEFLPKPAEPAKKRVVPTVPSPAPPPQKLAIQPPVRKGKKRKSDETSSAPVKHVKISDTNVFIDPNAPMHKPAISKDLSQRMHPPRVHDVLGELCEKLEIPNVGACGKDTDAFSLDDLFESDSGKTGECVQPIDNSLSQTVEFDLDMFV